MYYQITGTNVRLLGSMHLVPASVEAVPEWAHQAYAWCEELVIEHDPPTLLPFFKARTPLQSLLSSETYSALEALWPPSGPLFPLSELRPWAALIGLGLLDLNAIEGIEPHFLRFAQRDGKPVRYLEHADVVSQSFDTADIKEIEAAIHFTLSTRNLAQKNFVDAHSAWSTRDREQLVAIASATTFFTYPSLKAALLEYRNKAWASAIESLLPSRKPTLVVVGALHFCGSQNLLDFLRKPIAPVHGIG